MFDYQISNIVPKPRNGRRFVVGDIHGCSKTFKHLVKNKIVLTKEDQLFLLGDYINKGPKSRKVVKFILKLLKKGFRVYPLLGNHEHTLIQKSKEKTDVLLTYLTSMRSLDLLKDGKVDEKILEFFQTLTHFYELDHFYLVHAGFDFSMKHPFRKRNSMLFIRNFKIKKRHLSNKRIVHGHQPTPLNKIKRRIKQNKIALPLDNGACYQSSSAANVLADVGNLCCLNLDTMELIVQPNIEN